MQISNEADYHSFAGVFQWGSVRLPHAPQGRGFLGSGEFAIHEGREPGFMRLLQILDGNGSGIDFFINRMGDNGGTQDGLDDAPIWKLEDIEKESSKIVQRLNAEARPFKSTKNKFKKG